MKNIIVILFFIFASNVSAQIDSLKLSSDVWPPFTNVAEEKSIALDIVQEALESIDIPVNYEIVNFDLVMKGISSGVYDGSAALWWDETREEHLVFSEPYLQNQLVLIGKKGSYVNVYSLKEFKDKRIGVVENYAYGEFLEDDRNNRIIYSESDQQNLELLISDQIDYFLVDALLIQYLLKYQLNDVSEFLEIADHPLITKSLYLAIRKDIPDVDTIISQFNGAIKKMMADGSYNEILELNWITADVNNDGQPELIMTGNEAGTAEPDNSYNILYAEQNPAVTGFYINGTMYKSWDEVPDQYKVDIPKVSNPSSLDDATMKLKF